MAIGFVQALFSGTAKGTGSSLVLSGSKVVTAGNTIFVAFATSQTDGSPVTVTDNLGNAYAAVRVQNTSNMWAYLFRGDITNPGTLTTITIDQPPVFSIFGAVAAEFSRVGAKRSDGAGSGASTAAVNAYPGGALATTATYVAGDLWLGAFAQRSSNTFATETGVAPALEPIPEATSTGGTAPSNVSVGMLYYIAASSPGATRLVGRYSASAEIAGVGASFLEKVGVTYNDTCSGALTLSGSVTESHVVRITYTDSPTGPLALGGSVIESNVVRIVYTDAPAGTVAVTGSAVDSWGKGYTDARSGTLALSGTCVTMHTRSDAPSGTAALSGTCVDQWFIHASYSDAPVGVLALSGSATDIYAPPSPYEAAILDTPGLVSYWRLGEASGPAIDIKGDADLLLFGIVRVAGLLTDDPDGALEFSGAAGSYAQSPVTLPPSPGARLTWEFWCRPSAIPARASSVIAKVPGLLPTTWAIHHAADGRWQATVGDDNSVGTTVGPVEPAAVAGQLQHIVMTYDSVAGQMKLYINGASVGAQNRTPNAPVQSANARTYIGNDSNVAATGFVGVIDEVAFYNVALTPAQVLEHYELGGGAVTHTPSGRIALGGSNADALRRQSARTGSVALGGSVVERWLKYKNDAPAGVLKLAGTCVDSNRRIVKPTARLVVSGTRVENSTHTVARTGSISITGSAVERRGYADTCIGTISVTGTAEDDFHIVIGDDKPVGVLRLTGSSELSASFTDQSVGVLTLDGTSSDAFEFGGKIDYNDRMGGRIILRGRSIRLHEPGYFSISGHIVVSSTGRALTTAHSGRALEATTGRIARTT